MPPMTRSRSARSTSMGRAAVKRLDGYRRDRRALVRRAGLLALAGTLKPACISEWERGNGE